MTVDEIQTKINATQNIDLPGNKAGTYSYDINNCIDSDSVADQVESNENSAECIENDGVEITEAKAHH